jgi:hypothetical protein
MGIERPKAKLGMFIDTDGALRHPDQMRNLKSEGEFSR